MINCGYKMHMLWLCWIVLHKCWAYSIVYSFSYCCVPAVHLIVFLFLHTWCVHLIAFPTWSVMLLSTWWCVQFKNSIGDVVEDDVLYTWRTRQCVVAGRRYSYGAVAFNSPRGPKIRWPHPKLRIAKLMPRPGIEPGTFRSSVWRSPNWAIAAVESILKMCYGGLII